MKKNVLLIALTLICCGFTCNAHAQFLELLQKAAETTSKVIETKKDIDSYRDSRTTQSPSASYTKIGSVNAKRFNGHSTATANVDVVRTSSGEDKVLKNGSLYSICENYSYNEYCTDPKSSAYYRYYFNAGGAYYFNW